MRQVPRFLIRGRKRRMNKRQKKKYYGKAAWRRYDRFQFKANQRIWDFTKAAGLGKLIKMAHPVDGSIWYAIPATDKVRAQPVCFVPVKKGRQLIWKGRAG